MTTKPIVKTTDKPHSRDDAERRRPPRSTPAPVRHALPPTFSTRHGNVDAVAAAVGLVRRDLTTRELAVRAGSYNEADRSFTAVCATEQPVQVFDWRTFEVIDEILVADGGEFPERCPLLDSHQRYQSKDVIGSALDFRRVGREWEGRGVFAKDDPEVDKIASRVRDGHITDVSIGYEVLNYVDIPARATQNVNGRPYTAGERTLRVSTRWRVRELSTTPIGADVKAKIRSLLGGGSAAPHTIRSNSMNPRLLAYIRGLMHNPNATEQECRAYMAALRGSERTIANMLDYDVADVQARTTVDQALRSMGFDPSNPASPIMDLRNLPRGGQRMDFEEEEEERADDEEGSEERADDEEEETPRGRKKRKRSRQTPQQQRAAILAEERQRQTRIRELAGTIVPQEVLQRALDDPAISEERASVMFMQAVRDSRGEPLGADLPGGAPAIHSRASVTDYQRDALVAALMMRGSSNPQNRRSGISDPVQRRFVMDEQSGDMRFVDASQDAAWCRAVERGYQLRALPMVEIARRALEAGGVRVEPIPTHIVRAFERASTATVQSFVGIFTQTFGALMLDSFLQTRDTTEQWTIERENPNFLQNERHRVTKGRALTKHAKGGEAEDYALGDTTEYTRVFRYSAKTGIDEIDLINDTMFNAMRGHTPEEMGDSARRLRPDLVYSILLANPNLADGDPLFNATYGNLLYSATLNKTNLQRGTTVVRTRQENGVNLDLEARYLITPQALSYDARELIRSATVVIAGDTDTIRGSANALVDDALVPIADSRLDNGVTDPDSGTTYSGDTDDYYVVSEASRHTIEVTHLRASGRVPTLRSGTWQEGKWGIWFDVKQDIGAKALARAGMCKLTPSAAPS